MGLIEAFEEHLQKRDRSDYTVKGYVRDLQTFFAWLQEQTGKEIPTGEVTFFDVKRHRDELEDARKKPATVNRALSALRQFFDWMVAQGHVACNPVASVKQIRVKRRTPKSLSKQDVYLLQRTAAARQANSDGETEVLTAPDVVTCQTAIPPGPCPAHRQPRAPCVICGRYGRQTPARRICRTVCSRRARQVPRLKTCLLVVHRIYSDSQKN